MGGGGRRVGGGRREGWMEGGFSLSRRSLHVGPGFLSTSPDSRINNTGMKMRTHFRICTSTANIRTSVDACTSALLCWWWHLHREQLSLLP